jgi:small-conductance mechanosensitive channel
VLDGPVVRPLLVLSACTAVAVAMRRVTEGALRRRVGADDEDTQAIVDQLVRPLTVVLVLVGAHVAIGFTDLSEATRSTVRSLASTATILIVGRSLLAGLSVGLERSARRTDEGRRLITPESAPLYDIGGKVGVLFLTLWLLMLAWHVDVTAWLASAGVIGVVVGLAAQETLSNLLAGATILADAPYRVGHMIQLADGTRGVVREIGLRSTRLVTLDAIEIIIPNKEMATTRVVNISQGPVELERVALSVQVAYDSDLDHVRDVLLALVPELPAEPFNPATVDASVRFKSFDDSGITVRLLFHVRPDAREPAIDHALRAVHRAFRAHGVQIPFPQLDVHTVPTSAALPSAGPGEIPDVQPDLAARRVAPGVIPEAPAADAAPETSEGSDA